MARIWSEHSAICSAVAAAPHAITTARGTRSRVLDRPFERTHPPIEPPMTENQRSMPR